jgi:hypothetical protein
MKLIVKYLALGKSKILGTRGMIERGVKQIARRKSSRERLLTEHIGGKRVRKEK